MSEVKPYIWTPQEFLDGNFSLGEIGEIKDVPLEAAKAKLTEIAAQQRFGRTGIALLAFRQENIPESLAVPEGGFICPIYPSPKPEQEWRAFKQDLMFARTPGLLHAYNKDVITLPI